MLFSLVLLGIIIFIMILIILLLLSSIKIEIKNLRMGNMKFKTKYGVKVSINLFNRIKIFSMNLNSDKLKKMYNSKKLEEIDIRELAKKVPINKANFKELKKIKPTIEKMQLYIDLGTEDAVLTSYLIAIIASAIGIVLPHVTEDMNNCKYIVNPLYNGKNQFNIELDSIISLKIVHIIYVIYILIMKGRDKNERTSNRRSYGYSYGQY